MPSQLDQLAADFSPILLELAGEAVVLHPLGGPAVGMTGIVSAEIASERFVSDGIVIVRTRTATFARCALAAAGLTFVSRVAIDEVAYHVDGTSAQSGLTTYNLTREETAERSKANYRQ